MKVITIANKKGGIGKTATTVSLSALLGMYDQRVLVIDLNPGQANTSRYFDIQREGETIISIFENGNINEVDLRNIIKPTSYTNIHLLPANETLCDDESDIKINRTSDKELVLRDALKHVVNDYDYVIIDCGPNMNDLVKNALCASDGVLIPVQDDGQCFDGFRNLLFVIKDIQNNLNPNINILGVFFTMINPLTNTFKQYYSLYEREAGDKLLDVFIRRENAVKEAVSMKIPLPYYVKYSNAILDYERLLRELDLLHGTAAKKLQAKIRQGEAKENHRKKRDRRSRLKDENTDD